MQSHTSNSLFATHDIGARPRSLWSHVARVASRLRKYRRHQHDYQKLSAMSDHELKDIGLTRGDVVASFERGRWPKSRYHGA